MCDNGIDLAGAEILVNEVILNLDIDKTLLVSHGIQNDINILEETNLALKDIKN